MLIFERIARGWRLTKASFRVLSLDKEILALPLLAGVLMVAAVVGLGMGAFGLGIVNPDAPGYTDALVVFGGYFLAYAITIYFNAAVIEMATIRFNGGDPVLKDGFRLSNKRLGRILQWALIAATVGILLRILRNYARENAGFLGELLVGFIEVGWSLATFFVVPIAVYQNVGPFDAIRGSTGMMKRTWGDSVSSMITTGFVFLLLGLIGILPMGLGLWLLASGANALLAFGLMALAVVYWIALAAINMAVDGILVAGLYKFANEGRLPEAFQDSGIEPQQLAW